MKVTEAHCYCFLIESMRNNHEKYELNCTRTCRDNLDGIVHLHEGYYCVLKSIIIQNFNVLT